MKGISIKNKLGIKKSLRIMFITFIIVFIITDLLFLFRELTLKETREETVSLFSYSSIPDVAYSINLRQNDIYESRTIGEDNIYLSNYVDSVNADFRYSFQGERKCDVKGYYDVAAYVEAYTVQEKKHITIWKKKFDVVPTKAFSLNNKTVDISESVRIKLSEYNDFIKRIVEESEVEAQFQMQLIMNIKLKANTDKGLIEKNYNPSLTIPLDVRYFSIIKSDIGEETGSIEETRQVSVLPNRKLIILYGISLVLLVALFVLLIIFTTGYKTPDHESNLDKIFKQHGNRLVALDSEIAACCDSYTKVRTIEDLVRVADEIGRPILYKYGTDYKDIKQFFVYDDNQVYIYNIDTIGEVEKRKM